MYISYVCYIHTYIFLLINMIMLTVNEIDLNVLAYNKLYKQNTLLIWTCWF